jgi:hypothetical protein
VWFLVQALIEGLLQGRVFLDEVAMPPNATSEATSGKPRKPR